MPGQFWPGVAMPQVLIEFDLILRAKCGSRWISRACARRVADGWEGWIDFVPCDPSALPVRTGRETVHANRDEVLHWARGLGRSQLEGALQRALEIGPVSLP